MTFPSTTHLTSALKRKIDIISVVRADGTVAISADVSDRPNVMSVMHAHSGERCTNRDHYSGAMTVLTPVYTARVHGRPVSTTRVDGPS